MAGKKFTLAVVFLVGLFTAGAVAQYGGSFDQQPAPCAPSEGGTVGCSLSFTGKPPGELVKIPVELPPAGSGTGGMPVGDENLAFRNGAFFGGGQGGWNPQSWSSHGAGGDWNTHWWQGIVTPLEGFGNPGAGAMQPFIDIGTAIGGVIDTLCSGLCIAAGVEVPGRVVLEPFSDPYYGPMTWGKTGRTDASVYIRNPGYGQRIGQIDGYLEGNTAYIEWTKIEGPLRGQHLGTEAYQMWESKLPVSITQVRISAAPTPRKFWLTVGFKDTGRMTGGGSREMIKVLDR